MSQERHIPSDLSTALRFLITCCQTYPSDNDKKFILSHLLTINQQQLTSMASNHGILPLVYKSIKQIIEEDSSSLNTECLMLNAFLLELKPAYMAIVRKNMFMTSELIRIMRLLQKNSIDAFAFKGPTLSQMVYGDITLRQFGDLDIFIKKKDIKKVEELCISLGYKPYYDLTEVQKEVWYTYAKDMVFYHPQKKSMIEIHWLLLDADFPLQIDLDGIWEQTNTVELNKVPLNTFVSESLLLYLCIHGSKHLWERIVWIKDIDQMIRTQNIDWERVIILAQKSNLETMLFLGLSLSQDLLGTPLPKSVQETFKNEKELPELSDFVFKNWKSPQSIFQHSKAMLRFFPKFALKALYLHKIILKPSHNEYTFINLPTGLYWVYYLVRPYLLLKKYLTH